MTHCLVLKSNPSRRQHCTREIIHRMLSMLFNVLADGSFLRVTAKQDAGNGDAHSKLPSTPRLEFTFGDAYISTHRFDTLWVYRRASRRETYRRTFSDHPLKTSPSFRFSTCTENKTNNSHFSVTRSPPHLLYPFLLPILPAM